MALFSQNRGLNLERFINTSTPALKIGSSKPVSCPDTESLERAIPILASKYRRIPVIGKKTGDFRGFITTIDILDYLGAGPKHSIFRKRKGNLKISVKSIMETNVFALDKNHSIKKALEAFQRQRKGAYPITYRGKLMGIISEWDFVKRIDSRIGLRVGQLMVKKPLILKEDYTILETAKIMLGSGTRRLPVVRDNIMLGIVTPGDILSYLVKNRKLKGLRRDKTPITKVMEREVLTLESDQDISEAARVMREKRIGGLPVVDDLELLGILTERDIVDALKL